MASYPCELCITRKGLDRDGAPEPSAPQCPPARRPTAMAYLLEKLLVAQP
jgi:hypothetical protein